MLLETDQICEAFQVLKQWIVKKVKLKPEEIDAVLEAMRSERTPHFLGF